MSWLQSHPYLLLRRLVERAGHYLMEVAVAVSGIRLFVFRPHLAQPSHEAGHALTGRAERIHQIPTELGLV